MGADIEGYVLNGHERYTHRPAAQVLEDLSSTILAIAAHPRHDLPCDQLLAAAVYAARVSSTLTWSTVNPDLHRETGDIATGRVLLGTLNPSRELGSTLRVAQLKAARLLVTAAMDILDGTDSLLVTALAVEDMLTLVARWEPPRPPSSSVLSRAVSA